MISIADKMYFIEGKNHGRYMFSNSVYIDDERKAIIDTGVGKTLLRKLKKQQVINEQILVINSHCHEDHIAGNLIFNKSKIAIHKIEAPILADINKLIALYGTDDPKYKELNDNFYAAFGLKNHNADIKFEDGHIFDLGETKLQVIHAPGHSAGHCCFYEPKEKILFLSDIDLSGFGPWYGDMSSSINDFIGSIRKMIKFNPNVAISSHKGIYKDRIIEELKIFLEKIYEREARILEVLEKPHTLEEIVNKAIIYGKIPEPHEIMIIAEKIMVKLHLDRLLLAKKIQENPKDTFVAI